MNKNDMRFEWVDPKSLTPNPSNWRKHPKEQQDALEGVLAEVGWAGVAIVNERTGNLVDGHLRQKVAIEKGELLPVIFIDITEEQEKKALATHDPISLMARPDYVILEDLLKGIRIQDEGLKEMVNSFAISNGIDVNEIAKNIVPNPVLEESLDDEEFDPNNPETIQEMWEGMPEFEQEDKTAIKQLIINFETWEDYAAFGELIGVNLTEKTKSSWYPPKEIVELKNFHVKQGDES